MLLCIINLLIWYVDKFLGLTLGLRVANVEALQPSQMFEKVQGSC
jgi:CYTH domain-containing protein